jgi:hypothetical protein
MWFDPSLDEAYKLGIVPALKDAGFRGGRVDQKPHNDNITDRIRAGIRSAQLVVALFRSDPPDRRYGSEAPAIFDRGKSNVKVLSLQ